jgi:hypothetical protein
MDETGFQIGMGKDQLIVTKRKRAHYFSLPENRESTTTIECISATREFLPLFLILSGILHMTQWYQVKELDSRMAIIPTSSGYSNDEISLEWIKHFDKHTAKKIVGSKRLLILWWSWFTSHNRIHSILWWTYGGHGKKSSDWAYATKRHSAGVFAPLPESGDSEPTVLYSGQNPEWDPECKQFWAF